MLLMMTPPTLAIGQKNVNLQELKENRHSWTAFIVPEDAIESVLRRRDISNHISHYNLDCPFQTRLLNF